MGSYVARVRLADGSMGCARHRQERLSARDWNTDAEGEVEYATFGEARALDTPTGRVIGSAKLLNRTDLLEVVSGDPAMCDLRLLTALWAKEGAAGLARAAGFFSVAMLESQQRRFTILRDHFGVVPLYHCTHDGHFTCGSDIRAVLHLSGLPLAPDDDHIAHYILGESVEKHRTAFAGLGRLPGAHVLTIDLATSKAGASPQRYWDLPLPAYADPGQVPDLFRERLQESCAACASGSKNVGAMLSGGLDSSSLVAVLARQRAEADKPALPTVSFTYTGHAYDESEFIDELERNCHIDPARIEVTSPPDLSKMPEMVEEQMDLFLAYGLQKSRGVYDACERLGFTHVIDGHGGDEVVSHGYGRLVELAAKRRWLSLFREVHGSSRVHATGVGQVFFWLAARYGGFPERSLRRRALFRLARVFRTKETGLDPDFEAGDLLTHALKDRIDKDDAGDTHAENPRQEDLSNYAQRKHHEDLASPLMEHAFEVLHRAATPAGVAPLYPFFDRRLVEFCLSMPPETKLRNGATRWALRQGLCGILPDKIRLRTTKANFGKEFEASIRAYLSSGAGPCNAGLEDYVDEARARDLENSLRQNSDGQTSKARAYWRLIVLRDWNNAFATWREQQTNGELL